MLFMIHCVLFAPSQSFVCLSLQTITGIRQSEFYGLSIKSVDFFCKSIQESKNIMPVQKCFRLYIMLISFLSSSVPLEAHEWRQHGALYRMMTKGSPLSNDLPCTLWYTSGDMNFIDCGRICNQLYACYHFAYSGKDCLFCCIQSEMEFWLKHSTVT